LEHEEIGERIKRRRMELDISAAELASRLSMSKATVHRWENGEIKNIKIPVVVAIARELKVSATWLLGKSQDKNPIDMREAIDKYANLNELFDDLQSFFRYTEDLTSHGKRISESDRIALADGMGLLERVVLDRYR
jgi:transcriptional regulator with XRE-family HTH domain